MAGLDKAPPLWYSRGAMKKLILLRGPSGTGKSTIADYLRLEHNLCSFNDGELSAFHETDQFWVDNLGVYHFQLTKLKDAHKWNQLQTERSMLHGVPLVIVANTFIAHWEMNAYFALAQEYNYRVELIRTPGPWEPDILYNRNKHSVPLDVLRRHVNEYQPYRDEIEWTDMSIFKT